MNCLRTRLWIFWNGHRGERPPILIQQHSVECRQCARRIREWQLMHSQLTQSTDEAPADLNDLHGRIMDSIRNTTETNRSTWSFPVRAGLAGAAFAVVLLLISLNESGRFEADRNQVTDIQAVQDLPVLEDWGLRLSSGEQLLALAETMETPLHAEMERVILDARSAVNSLAGEFLPGGLAIKKTSRDESN